MKTYKSKLGPELVIPIIIVFGGLTIKVVLEKSWIGIAFTFLVVSFISHMFITTKYRIEKENLNIKCGFLFNENIGIKTILKISETNNILSSAATSIDRLEIIYNKFDSVLVSPKDKKGFIDSLTEINPNIEVKYEKS
ncbi:PH domain-containing protein [Flavobacterium sp. ZS1P14]|uniref:PH domain-containing protein n=1 Tax=Flavobacterium sp. ZS1P14 TaxID=3401729 RepID=UPI003AAC05CE